MDERSLERIEFPRIAAAVAARAESAGARALLLGARPLADVRERGRENALLHEAIRRESDPGAWCHVGLGSLSLRLRAEDADGQGTSTPVLDSVENASSLDGPGLVEVLGWIVAAEATRGEWAGSPTAGRFPGLQSRAAAIADFAALRQRLEHALEPDGRVSDGASPVLRRLRTELERGERALERSLEQWGRGFGEGSYVTRHDDRFVVLVPAAGFPRRRGIVHDVSGSGHSLFVEPFEACDRNNRLKELRAAVVEEERRVLIELRGSVRAVEGELEAMEGVLVHLDSLRARARWAREWGGIAADPGGERLRLVSARHPLLAMRLDSEPPVPLDLELGPENRLLLVSGPNMGGKTVLLKTVGLTVALSHAGFPVLASEGSEIPEIEDLKVDIGDEQSLDQGLSTFAAHLRSLADMAAHAGPRTLILGDELGAGTDPEEGAALGRALMERFAARHAWAVMTTHLGSLKRVAGDIRGVMNGSLDFDTRTLAPRYRFVAGVPGASHALSMAERMGLDREVLERARALAPEESRALERLLEDLHETRRRMEEGIRSLETARAEALKSQRAAEEAAEQARAELSEVKHRLTRDSEAVLARARELWQSIQREARRADKSRAEAAALRERLQAAERDIEELGTAWEVAHEALTGGIPRSSDAAHPAPQNLVPGMRVQVVDLGLEAELVEGPDPEGKVVLRRGSWNIHSHVSRLALPALNEVRAKNGNVGGGPASKERPPLHPGSTPDPPSPSPRGGPGATWQVPDEAPLLELDLRGMEVEEALRSLDQGLDRGVLSGLSELRVIHGVGRGVLRAAVERHLHEHPQVASQRMGQWGEGGRGVTVAKLR